MIGALSLIANNGVYMSENMNTQTSNKALVMNADSDSSGSSGTLTVASSKTVTSNNSDVTITAWDIDLQGSLTAGTASIKLHGAESSQTIGIGGTVKNMQLSNGELARITSITFNIGASATSGNIFVDGITDANSATIGTLTLVSMNMGGIVSFETSVSKFNKGVVIQA